MKKQVAILGASGMIGQQFARILADHPKFDLTTVFGKNSAGRTMEDIWGLPGFNCPVSISDMVLEKLELNGKYEHFPEIVFSALPARIAERLEHQLRMHGIKVFSNSSTHRMDENVPILIPEINGPHVRLVKNQQENLGTTGYIVTNSNCSAAGSAIYLAELKKLLKLEQGVITTYQAVSGAGLRGITALEIGQNVIPFIKNEEPKIIAETKKMIGKYNETSRKIVENSLDLVANTARVPVVDGHLEAITVFSSNVPPLEDLTNHFSAIKSPLDTNKYYIAPQKHLQLQGAINRPQPKLDVLSSETESTTGMVVHLGRIRRTDSSVSAYVLVHNTIRGGAGGSVLNAEYVTQKGY